MEGSCQDMQRRWQQFSACKAPTDSSALSQTMEKDIKSVVNMTNQIEEELKINVRFSIFHIEIGLSYT